MNDLTERLQRLGDAGADGIAVTRPELAGPRRPWWRRTPVLAVAAVVVAVVVGTGALLARDGDDDDTVIAEDPAATGTEALVAVTYGDASMSTEPIDLTLRFLGADRQFIAERSWSEVEERMAGAPDQLVTMGGLVQRVPAGDLELRVLLKVPNTEPEPTGYRYSTLNCDLTFSAAAGDRLILRVTVGLVGGRQCAQIETVEDWVQGRTGATGAPYVGLSRPEAEARAVADGLTTRAVAVDGIDLAVTLDLRPDRLNLMLFDGIVVAAQLDGEEPMANPPDPVPGDPSDAGGDPGATPTGEGTLAVDLERIEGILVEGFDVTLRFYDPAGQQIAEREWSAAVAAAGSSDDPDAYYSHVLREVVPAGRIRLVTFMRVSPGGAIPPPQGPGCETSVDVGADDAARVTVLFARDDVSGACAAVSSATAEADELLGMPRGLPAPGFVGLSEDEATAEAEARGWTIRVLARDGDHVSEGITDDYRPERVNLVFEDGVVAAAART